MMNLGSDRPCFKVFIFYGVYEIVDTALSISPIKSYDLILYLFELEV